MSSVKRMIRIFSLLTIVFVLGFSMNVNAEEGNDYSKEVVPGHEKTERWSYTYNYYIYTSK